MTKQFDGNEDWLRREHGRIPSKGAMAAERASAGLGTSDDDEYGALGELRPAFTVWAKPGERTDRSKPAERTPQPDKP
jgi:hypothetical protein